MKKVWILLLAVLLLALSAGTVNAEEVEFTPNDTLVRQAEQLYIDCLRVSGRESFHGFCGLMTSYQLWKLGVNEELLICDGNKQFDAYKDVETTSGGYTVRAYSAQEYTLEEALYAISAGKKTVRNILVGFQWTNTQAGAIYGHACVVNAIEDGMVYFTESFDHAMGHMEGDVIVCTIPEFAKFFADWTVFEGVIYFGDKEYADSCTAYGTDTYLQVRFDSNLRSQPCLLEENDCRRIRTLKGGEILHATGVYENGDGDLFYQIADGNVVSYVSANAVFVLQTKENPGALTHAQIPTALAEGEVLALSGRVRADRAVVSALRLELTDKDGNMRFSVQTQTQGLVSDLNALNAQLSQATLEKGGYCLKIIGTFVNYVVENGIVTTLSVEQELCRQVFAVGEGSPAVTLSPQTVTRDGWFEENGTWYCHKDGKPCTGWVTRVGIQYYLREDGSVTTGWAKPDGVRLYFSSTGALCSGWVVVGGITYYRLPDGSAATGQKEIDGITYQFNDKGALIGT